MGHGGGFLLQVVTANAELIAHAFQQPLADIVMIVMVSLMACLFRPVFGPL
jgi:hypothetical protein